MRAISATEEHAWLCERCGGSRREPIWTIVDLDERPDLRPELAGGELHVHLCPTCGFATPRTRPLLVANLSVVAPNMVLLQEAALGGSAPPPEVEALELEFLTRLKAAGAQYPGPPVYAPFEVLPLAVTRDLEADLQLPDGSRPPRGVEAEVWQRHLFLLDAVRRHAPFLRLYHGRLAVLDVESLAELEVVVARFPELCTQAAYEYFGYAIEVADGDPERDMASAQQALVQHCIAGTLEVGWREYDEATRPQRLWARAMDPAVPLVERDRAGEELRAQLAEEDGLDGWLVITAALADALYGTPGPGWVERIERCIELRQEGLARLDAEGEEAGEIRFRYLGNLGAAYGRRGRFDPIANQERAIECQREALTYISMETHEDEWAIAQTNLGLGILELAWLRRPPEESPDPDALAAHRALVDEAIECFEQALEWRSFERHPGNWAYTQINYGVAYARRRSDDPVADSHRAIEHFDAAGHGFRAAGHTAHYAQTLYNIADERVRIAHHGDLDEAARTALLREAEQGLVSAIEVDGIESSPQATGRAWRRLSDVLLALGRPDEAISALGQALVGLTPEGSPGYCRDAAARLAWLHAEDERWEYAADAGRLAAEAAVAAMEAAATPARRLDEVRSSANLFRWSAYALVRAGRLTEAVEMLELGRAREIGARLTRDADDLGELAEADPELHERYVSVRARLDAHESVEGWSRDGSLVSAADLSEELDVILAAIRATPGFASFLASPSFNETLAGISPAEALVYLITAPAGSVALIVTPALDAEGGVAAVESVELTSTGMSPLFVRPGSAPGQLDGFLPAQARGDDAEITAALAELAKSLGPTLLRPLAERLDQAGVQTVALVPLALLSLVPIQALQWDAAGVERSLLDDFDVVFAPSGLIRRICIERAARHTGRPVRLVAVGNPLPAWPPLPGAEREAEMVAATLPSDQTVLLTREDATRAAVEAALPGATHIHFACHGEASFDSVALDAGLLMSGEQRLMAADFLAMDDFQPRIVAASACETGVIQEYDAIDEAFSLGTALVAAGAAGVVSSLWQISDEATDLLMTRFYETLAHGTDPVAALRDAQLWLRDLRRGDAVAFLRERRRLRSAGTGGAANRGEGDDRPYAAPWFWAAFTFTGA